MFHQTDVVEAMRTVENVPALVMTISVVADDDMDIHEIGVSLAEYVTSFIANMHAKAHPDGGAETCNWTPPTTDKETPA